MSVIAGQELLNFVNAGYINAPVENVGASSVDLTLSSDVYIEEMFADNNLANTVDITSGERPTMSQIRIGENGMVLRAGQCILTSANEIFNLPPYVSAQFSMKSSLGRCFLEHMNSCWIQAGWAGQLTLELKNMLQYQNLIIKEGMKIGQVVFFRHSNTGERSYGNLPHSQYHNQSGTTQAFNQQ